GAPLWLHNKGFEVVAQTEGPGAGEGLEAWLIRRGGERQEGVCEVEALSAKRFEWTCTFAGGYIAPGAEESFEVYIQAGPPPEGERARARRRAYNADAMPPLSFYPIFPPAAVIGESFRVCAGGGIDKGSGLQYVEIAHISVALPSIPAENIVKNGHCYDIHVPLDLGYGTVYSSSMQVSVGVRAVDNVGNEFGQHMGVTVVSLSRIACRGDALTLEESVTHPPVLAGENVVLGTGKPTEGPAYNSLYFMDKNCGVVSQMHTGALKGPMVALGGSGRVAAAVEGGGPGWSTPEDYRPGVDTGARLLLVGPGGRIHDKEMDCLHNPYDAHSSASFDRGLSLVRWGNAEGTDEAWLLSAPLNSAEAHASQLVAYQPNAGRCTLSSISTTSSPTSLDLAPIWGLPNAAGERHGVLSIRSGDVQQFALWASNGTELRPTGVEVSGGGARGSLSGIALAQGNRIWATSGWDGRATGVLSSGSTIAGFDATGWANSPAAVDSLGRTYIVEAWLLNSGSQQLLRLNVDGTVSASGGGNSQTLGRAVGSPLLGQAVEGGQAEVYIVTTQGYILAYLAETLGEPLWSVSTGLSISPTAQPLLTGNTLWVVGTRGEVVAIRVNSNGLSRSAQWPRHLHDNCNTGNAGAGIGVLPACIE
ncbi:MAG: PQQ-like beta-propeller repeat protein, partial [Proteobacteria bacterium]|nr:PQQ-like beta-propeller repeat protein [Pseudomonadota bacterium]